MIRALNPAVTDQLRSFLPAKHPDRWAAQHSFLHYW